MGYTGVGLKISFKDGKGKCIPFKKYDELGLSLKKVDYYTTAFKDKYELFGVLCEFLELKGDMEDICVYCAFSRSNTQYLPVMYCDNEINEDTLPIRTIRYIQYRKQWPTEFEKMEKYLLGCNIDTFEEQLREQLRDYFNKRSYFQKRSLHFLLSSSEYQESTLSEDENIQDEESEYNRWDYENSIYRRPIPHKIFEGGKERSKALRFLKEATGCKTKNDIISSIFVSELLEQRTANRHRKSRKRDVSNRADMPW